MNILGIALMVLGTLCIAGLILSKRWIFSHTDLTVQEQLTSEQVLGFLFLASALFWWPDREWTSFDFPAVYWMGIAGLVLTDLVIQYAGSKSLQLGEASLVAPVSAMTPGLVTLSALLLGEHPSLQGWIGVLLIAGGNYFHSHEGAAGWRDYLKPFRMLFLPTNFASLSPADQVEALRSRSALRWAYLSALLGSIGLISGAVVARYGSIALGTAINCLTLSVVYGAMYARTYRRPQEILSGMGRYWWVLFLPGILWGLHELFVSTAFRLAPIAYIGSLKRFSIVIVVLLSWLVLGEKKAKKRLLAAAIITIGALLLAFDPGIEHILNHIDFK